MNSLVLQFDNSGCGHCLYSEIIDLNTLGPLEVRRASTVEFNNGEQRWEVKSPEGTVLFSHASRAVCLSWEHQQFS